MVTRFEKFKASFWCLFKTFIPLKMFQTFRRAKRPFYKHAWITNWNQILIKRKSFTKRSSIFQHYFEEIFFEEYFKKREIRFFQPSNEYTSFSYLSSKLDNSRFPQGNEKLPRKQEFLDKAVQAVSLSRKRKPSTPSQDLFLPVDPFEPSFSIDFFFFFFFFFVIFFHAAVAFHSDDRSTFRAFPRDTASCSNCQRLWKRARSTREEGEGQYSSRFFDDDVSLSPLLVELLEWGCSKRK